MLNGISNLSADVDVLKESPDEVARYYKDRLIGVTAFFRDQDVFERLELDVIPALMDRPYWRDLSIRVISWRRTIKYSMN